MELQDYRVLSCLGTLAVLVLGGAVVAVAPIQTVPAPSEPLRAVADGRDAIHEAQAWALAELGPVQYRCLDAIVTRESRWRLNATNRTSGAYGWFQAYPASKLRDRSPMGQMRWGIAYANRRYGSMCKAWAFWQRHGWY